MRSCDDFTDLLLDHLYGLVEPDEDAALRVHLSECAKCQAALHAAGKQQSLLSQAAQMYGELAPFVAPVEKFVPVPAEAAASVPLPTKARRFSPRWAWVAAAAAVLLAVVGGMWWYQDLAADARQQANRARRQVEAVDAQIARVNQEFQQQRDRLPAQVQEQLAHLHVVGPAVMQSDAPAPFRVTTRDVAGKPRPAEVLVRWRGDETREFRFASAGEQLVELPAGLTSGAGRAIIEVESRAAGTVAKVTEAVEVNAPAFVTHLALNKSAYRIGEVLFFRTLTLQRYSLTPPAEKIALRYALLDAQGQPKKEAAGFTGAGGIAGGEFALTEDLLDGDYTFEVTELGDGSRMPPQRRRIEIQRGLNPQIEFDRRQYRPGDEVTALFRARRLANGAPAPNQPITGSAKLDGKFLPAPGAAAAPGLMQTLTNEHGVAALKFRLPERIDKGNAVVEVQQHDGTKDEKLARRIPVVTPRLTVDFFPEGGELVAGVPTRVYYRVRTPLGEPAAPEGHVILMSTKEVLLDSPRNQGIGEFTFTPQLNETYTLRVTWPKRGGEAENWVETTNPFQDLVQGRGVALHVPAPVTHEGQPLAVTLRNTGAAKRLALVALCRGRVVDQRFVAMPAGVTAKDGAVTAATVETSLTPVAGAAGLIRVTVYEPRDGQLVPLAERLVYQLPVRTLTFSVVPNKPEFLRSDRVGLALRARDENGQASAAWALGLVVDERVAPQQPGLPAQFYLLSEGRQDIDNADLLVSEVPNLAWFAYLLPGGGAIQRALETAQRVQAAHALDLYLGTSGWRRFVAQPENVMFAQGGFGGAQAKGGGAKADPKAGDARGGDPNKVGATRRTGAEAPALLSSENISPARLGEQYQSALQQAVDNLRQPAEEKLKLLVGDRDRRLSEARAAALALVTLEENTRGGLRLGLAILLVGLLVVGGLLLLYSVLRMARAQTSPRTALVSAMLTLLCAVVLYSAGGKLLGPDRDADDALARLGDKGSPALPERMAGAVPAWGEIEGLFFARGLRRENGDDTRGNLGVHKATADQLAGEDKALAYAPQAQAAGPAAEGGKRLSPSAERFAWAAQKQGRAQELMKKADAGPSAKKGKTAEANKGGQVFRETDSEARHYAHTADPAGRGPDLQDTVSWEPTLLVPENGATVSFGLSQSPTTYRIFLYGNSPSGRLGYFQATLRVR